MPSSTTSQPFDQPLDVRLVDVGDFGLDGDLGVDLRDATRGRDGLRRPLARVALGEHRLPLQVRLLDEVAVNDAQPPDAGARQHLDLRRPERAAPDDQRARRDESPLSLRADALEKNLPAVTFHMA